MSSTPGSYAEYMEGLSELARQSLAAREAGEEETSGGVMAYTAAMVARSRFLNAADQLTTASGMTAAEVEQVAAGVLALASRVGDSAS